MKYVIRDRFATDMQNIYSKPFSNREDAQTAIDFMDDGPGRFEILECDDSGLVPMILDPECPPNYIYFLPG